MLHGDGGGGGGDGDGVFAGTVPMMKGDGWTPDNDENGKILGVVLVVVAVVVLAGVSGE